MMRLITTKRLEKMRADAAELHRIKTFAKRQSRKMDDVARDGRNARPPEGEDWNALASMCGAWEEEP